MALLLRRGENKIIEEEKQNKGIYTIVEPTYHIHKEEQNENEKKMRNKK